MKAERKLKGEADGDRKGKKREKQLEREREEEEQEGSEKEKEQEKRKKIKERERKTKKGKSRKDLIPHTLSASGNEAYKWFTRVISTQSILKMCYIALKMCLIIPPVENWKVVSRYRVSFLHQSSQRDCIRHPCHKTRLH